MTAFVAFAAGLLIFGSTSFYVILSLVALGIVCALEYEKVWGATLTALATIFLVIFCNGGIANFFTYTYNHLLSVLLYVAGYFLVGAAWSAGKWWFYTKNLSDKYLEIRGQFLRSCNVRSDNFSSNSPLPAELKEKWEESLKNSYSHYGHSFTLNSSGGVVPNAYDHKSTILMWMGHWPLSMFWTLMNDPVKRLLKFMYARLARLYEYIAISNFKNTANDFLTPEERKTLEEKKKLNPDSEPDPFGPDTARRGNNRFFGK